MPIVLPVGARLETAIINATCQNQGPGANDKIFGRVYRRETGGGTTAVHSGANGTELNGAVGFNDTTIALTATDADRTLNSAGQHFVVVCTNAPSAGGAALDQTLQMVEIRVTYSVEGVTD
jgi:hypothetical protein